eukprot:635960-Prymnesium_polylepis.1
MPETDCVGRSPRIRRSSSSHLGGGNQRTAQRPELGLGTLATRTRQRRDKLGERNKATSSRPAAARRHTRAPHRPAGGGQSRARISECRYLTYSGDTYRRAPECAHDHRLRQQCHRRARVALATATRRTIHVGHRP